jgi:hypothetical protein
MCNELDIPRSSRCHSEVYIDDVVVKYKAATSHLVDLRLALERMRKYGLKINPLKCAFVVSTERFMRFIIHKHGKEIDPKKIKSIQKVKPLVCKKHV